MRKLTFLSILLFSLLIVVTSCIKDHSEIDRITAISDFSNVPLSMHKNSGLAMTKWPSTEDPGPPFYALIEPEVAPYVYHNGTYAAIVFYRDPALIPADFNLLSFFDVPRAFSVPLTVTGTSLWHGEVGAGGPKVVNMEGNVVPIWFVPVSSLLLFINTNATLTINDLSLMPGLITGIATFFREVLHPHPLPPQFGGGGHPVPKMNITAKGTLNGGGEFQLNISARQTAMGWQRNTRIRIL